QTSDTLLQPPTTNHQQFRDRIPVVLEASYHKVAENLVLVEKEQVQHAASDHYTPQQISNPHPPYQEGHRRHEEAFPGGMTQKELQENEELKKVKEKNKELQARIQQLLSKVMGMHEKSENINDPSHLSAVLKMYEMLRLHDWEKFRSFSFGLTYKRGRSIIEKLFEACEKDIQQRTAKIFEVIGIPASNDAMTNSEQGLMQAIRSVFRYSYYKNDSEFYSEIIMEPPVEAVWKIEESSWQDLEHVDKTDRELWRKPVCLWPIMKCGKQVIVKGVVWESQVSIY
ncbi:hypothetical protein Q9233_015958, partial [Columba guinea]